MTTAREEILGRIRASLSIAPVEVQPVVRDYDAELELPDAERIDLLVERLEDYRARVRRATTDTAAAEVAAALAETGARRVGVPAGLDPALLAGFDGEVQVDGPEIPAASLDRLDAIVTGAAVACATTGTIMLDGSPDQGRRALTLVPDVHVCVVRDEQVVVDMPAAIRRLVPERPITMIAGPSATSDIELQRVEGVHGPRTLIVIVVTDIPASDRG
ncbi:LutC/YkgG family protein [Pseudoclavibacter caeni]|jgi:L-lactate dehydrogenase complex protein LldG|uniref:Lactate utilization protein C n=1 Tax=Pseudoclavibacter caeni TaxID=908846 RepID=A0A7C8FWV2_9MICO|nr:LUD domain-containing protein [Pseudoclavibacter caeni]KAB1631702.1 lactate utilization protein C [Pseudoclavibacter caeni]NYJ97329.1 L-lactate dehydrogenase complex protein LldG [Pseudoclavibacter caeni]